MEKEKIKESLVNYMESEPDKKFTVQELADKLEMNKAGQFNFVVHNLNTIRSSSWTMKVLLQS